MPGCTDHGCIVRDNKGMHTNGGCKCLVNASRSQLVILQSRIQAVINQEHATADLQREAEVKPDMTPDDRVDAVLEMVLKAAGTSLKHFTMQKSRDDLREAMRLALMDAYIQGGDDAVKALRDSGAVR
jgi:hypothetical protein